MIQIRLVSGAQSPQNYHRFKFTGHCWWGKVSPASAGIVGVVLHQSIWLETNRPKQAMN